MRKKLKSGEVGQRRQEVGGSTPPQKWTAALPANRIGGMVKRASTCYILHTSVAVL